MLAHSRLTQPLCSFLTVYTQWCRSHCSTTPPKCNHKLRSSLADLTAWAAAAQLLWRRRPHCCVFYSFHILFCNAPIKIFACCCESHKFPANINYLMSKSWRCWFVKNSPPCYVHCMNWMSRKMNESFLLCCHSGWWFHVSEKKATVTRIVIPEEFNTFFMCTLISSSHPCLNSFTCEWKWRWGIALHWSSEKLKQFMQFYVFWRSSLFTAIVLSRTLSSSFMSSQFLLLLLECWCLKKREKRIYSNYSWTFFSLCASS